MSNYRTILACLLSMTLLACSSATVKQNKREIVVAAEQTLANLEPVDLNTKQESIEPISLSELRDLYLEVLSVSDDPIVRLNVKDRLASLEIQRSEEQLLVSDSQEPVFNDAIKAYKDLMAENPNSDKQDRQLYQLAKAYELNGDIESSLDTLQRLVNQYPQSSHYIEAEFRLGESHFSNGDYREAGKRYQNVINKGDSAYYQNAHYMQAWSLFKALRYDDAIRGFVNTLDLLLPTAADNLSLSRGKQEVVDDCYRMLSVTFATLDGVQVLSQTLQDIGPRHYTANLYEGLAKHHLKQERFKDSADVYQVFINNYPASDEAYRYHVEKIKVYKQGGFAKEVLEQKEGFIEAYNHDTDYWKSRDSDITALLDEFLKSYSVELASYYHTLAQTSKKASVAKQYYIRAIQYYSLFVVSFPDDKRSPDMMFLLAESQYDIARYLAAIGNYERVAYEFTENTHAVEAGYAAVLSYEKLLQQRPDGLDKEATAARQNTIKRDEINSSLKFANTFPLDARAPNVLLTAANNLFALEEYTLTIHAAEKLTQWQQKHEQVLDTEIIIPAWLLIGHSTFAQAYYVYAEKAYEEVLLLLDPKDKRVPEIMDRQAASIYKQAEQAQLQQQYAQAAEQYLRVIALAPESEIRLNAQYDAATALMEIAQWQQAIDLLTDFRQRFKKHPLTDTLYVKLSVAYQETEQWQLAADELFVVYTQATDETEKAQLLYLTAELYEKAKDTQKAIIHYRRYAHAYAEPFSINFEAMNKLSELYLSIDDDYRRKFWLKRMIKNQAALGVRNTQRTTYLAAYASSVFADQAYNTFTGIKLSLPIKKSFKRKRKALTEVIGTYQRTAAYGVAEFTTLSSFRLAEVYGQLSRDLMDSERPNNLDALALEQYELLLEEQAFPFEEKAIEIHEKNIANSWQGVYDLWVKQSFKALQALLPARYNKPEQAIDVSEGIY